MGREGRPVKCLDTGEVFETALAAARAVGTTPMSITNCCQGRQNTVKGKRWVYVLRKKPENVKAKSPKEQTLCWDCYRSDHWEDDPTPCPWARDFEPVEGWVADHRTVRAECNRMAESYFVIKCPLFEPDKKRNKAKGGRPKKC